MSTPVLTAEFSENLHLPGGLPQPMAKLEYEPDSKTLVFDDGTAVYGYSSRGRRIFRIAAQAHLHGWTTDAADLFVQDGPVLCHYDLMALDPHSESWPVKALNMETRRRWSNGQPPDKLKELYPDPPSTARFSAPVAWNREPAAVFIYVLLVSDETKVFRVAASLDPSGMESWSNPTLADTPPALFAVDDPAGPFLQFLRAGRATTLRMHPLKEFNEPVPPESPDHWRRVMGALGATIAGRPWTSCVLRAGREAGDVWACCSSDRQSHLYVAPDSGADRARVGLLSAGGFVGGDLGADSDPRRLRSIPAIVHEHRDFFLYALTQDGQGNALLEKYKLAEALPWSAQQARVLIDTEFAGFAAWASAGIEGCAAWTSSVPLERNASTVCAGAVLEALGMSDPTIAGRLPAAGPAAAPGMMALSADRIAAVHVAGAIARVCRIAVGPLLPGYGEQEKASGLRLAGWTVEQTIEELQPRSFVWGFIWYGQYDLAQRGVVPGPVGSRIAGVIHAAGYSQLEVAQLMRHEMDFRPWAGVVTLKVGYSLDADGIQAIARQVGGDGFGPTRAAICTYYHVWCSNS
jgi:hypothetical protein